MRAVVQRVRRASVTVAGEVVGEIGRGLLVLLGAGEADDEADADYMAGKIVGLRIFADDRGQMNRSLLEVGGQLLVVSQFTLYGDCRRGRRPSFLKALAPKRATELVDLFVHRCADLGVSTATGRFGAMMDVDLCNDGPVTLLVDSHKQF